MSKDGPSAGVTIVAVLASMFSSICVAPDLAMTGEMTLRGVVLPVCDARAVCVCVRVCGGGRVTGRK